MPLAMMDGSNLQLLIVPKGSLMIRAPNHTRGERKGRSQGKRFRQQNWDHLGNGGGRIPHLSLSYKSLSDVFSYPS